MYLFGSNVIAFTDPEVRGGTIAFLVLYLDRLYIGVAALSIISNEWLTF